MNPDSFAKLNQFDSVSILEDRKFAVLFKGRAGAGKSTAALSFPGPHYIVTADLNDETNREGALDGKLFGGAHIGRGEWGHYADIIVPAVVNRRVQVENKETGEWIPAQTIVVDSISFLAQICMHDIVGNNDRTQRDYGRLLDRLQDTTASMLSARKPMRNQKNEITHPGYNIVFTCHLRDLTDTEGNVLSVAPDIDGQFRGRIDACFDYTLLCKSEMKTSLVEIPGGGKRAEKSKQFTLYAAAPDAKTECKGGRLPAELIIEEGQSVYDRLNETWKVGVPSNASDETK